MTPSERHDAEDAAEVVAPFVTLHQQQHAARLGMWLFLASEAMMFGSLIVIAWLYRLTHPQGVAEAVERLNYLLAAGNTLALVTSSLLMSLALVACKHGQGRQALGYLLGAACLGGVFLACKGLEYTLEYQEGLLPGFGLTSPLQQPSARLFMNLYFVATALHGVHLLVAIGLVLAVAWRLRSTQVARGRLQTQLEMTALYWHLVDAIWLLLFPTLYLIGR